MLLTDLDMVLLVKQMEFNLRAIFNNIKFNFNSNKSFSFKKRLEVEDLKNKEYESKGFSLR